MDNSRRTFLKGFGLVVAGTVLMPDDVLRRIWALGAPLRLWGDGIHDDTPALQAIFEGKGASVEGYVDFPGRVVLRNGIFLCKGTVRATDILPLELRNLRFDYAGPPTAAVIGLGPEWLSAAGVARP